MPTTYTKTVGTASRDYSTITLAEADIGVIATSSDLVSNDEEVIFDIYDDGDFSEAVTVAGTTTDATRTVTFRAASGEAHTGSYGTGVTVKPGSNAHAFTIDDDHIRIERLEPWTGTSVSNECVRNNGGVVGTIVDGCILRPDGTQASTDGVYAGNATTGSASYPITTRNCLLVGFSRAGVHAQQYSNSSDGRVHNFLVVNCTFNECDSGIGYANGDHTVTTQIKIENCLADENVTRDYGQTGTTDNTPTTTGSATNYGEWGGASTQFPANQTISSQTVDFTDSLSPAAGQPWAILTDYTGTTYVDYNFLLIDDADNDVQGAGTGPSSDSDVPTTDCLGNTRSGTTCDVGWHEVTSGSTTHSVDGSTDSVSSLSGTIEVTREVDGSTAGTSSLTGTVGLRRPLDGSTALTSALSGSAGLRRPLDGSTSLTSALAGTIRATQGVEGSTSLVTSLAGVPSVTREVGGTSSLSSVLGGTLTLTLGAEGETASLTSTLSGVPSVTRGVDGSTSLASVLGGTLSRRRAVDGSTSLTSALSAAASATYKAEGSTSGASALSGIPGVRRGVDGSTALTSSLSGTLSVSGSASIAGSTFGVSALSGVPSVTRRVDGSTTLTSALAGSLLLRQPIDGTTSLTSALTGTLLLRQPIDGSTSLTSALTGTLTISGAISIDGSTSGTSALSGTLSVTRGIVGSTSLTSALSGTLTITMARPILTEIVSNNQNWQALVNDLFTATWDAPFPVVYPADISALESSFAPELYDSCFAATDFGSTKVLVTSDGTNWIPL